MIDEKKLIMAIANWQMTLMPGWSSANDTDTVIHNTLEEVIGLIESQPPADQWIPCSRELPKQNQHIIGTFESDKGKRFVCDDTYFPQLLSEPWKLIAWMPAEPYKGVKERERRTERGKLLHGGSELYRRPP